MGRYLIIAKFEKFIDVIGDKAGIFHLKFNLLNDLGAVE